MGAAERPDYGCGMVITDPAATPSPPLLARLWPQLADRLAHRVGPDLMDCALAAGCFAAFTVPVLLGVGPAHPHDQEAAFGALAAAPLVFEALRSGASGFVLKDTQPEKLLDAIRIVAAGEALLAPAITRRLIAEFARRPRAAAPSAGDVLAPLTEREREVLQQVAAGSSNAEVAAALHLSVATVKTHISRLLSKLDCRDRAQLVVVAYETGVAIPGLRLSPPRPG
jgi:DNA-binding CsgD family transcriptional regulator